MSSRCRCDPGAGRAARSRWPIEQQYREPEDDLGLDRVEGRTYQGWTHHVVLTAVAFTLPQIERARPPDGPRPTPPVVREIMGLLYTIVGCSRCTTASAGTRYEDDKVVLG